MKAGRLYVAALVGVLVLIFIAELNAPHKFSWTPSFDRRDKEPFGCFVFDDVAQSSLNNYKVVNKTFYQIWAELGLTDSIAENNTAGRNERGAYLVVEDNMYFFNKTDIEHIFKLLHSGSDVMLCVDYLPHILSDTLRIKTKEELEDYSSIERYLDSYADKRDSIYIGSSACKPEHIFEVYPPLHNSHLLIDSSDRQQRPPFPPKTLACDSRNHTLALQLNIGRGRLFLVSTPLMFTNYGVLDGSNAGYAFRLLSHFEGKPVVRLEAYGKHSEEPETPLRYVLSLPPLRWALYTTLIVLLLFMGFSVRRRQRVIPVVTSPPNRTLGFMQLISDLYLQRHDNSEMLRLKYRYFSAELKRLTMIDITDRTPSEADFEHLSELSGIETDIIRPLLKNVLMATYRSYATDNDLRNFVDGMNDLLRAVR